MMNQNFAKKRVAGLSMLLFAVLAIPVFLNMSAPAGGEHTGPGGAVSALQLASGFFFVLALIILLAWIARNWLLPGMKAGAQRNELHLIEKLPLTQQSTLVLVRVCGKKLLLGVSGESIQMLSEYGAEEHEPKENSDEFHPVTAGAQPGSHRFAQILENLKKS